MHITNKLAVAVAAIVAAGLLAGCGNFSQNVKKDGSGAQKLEWPALTDTNPLNKGGTFPNLDNLRNVQAGLTKNQVLALIGPPHFGEGLAGVREWNYLFNFRNKDGTVTQCEFKILYDAHMLARSFYWHPEACADYLNPPAAKPAEAVETFTLSADALFAFDKYALGDIKQQGRDELDALAGKLNDPKVQDAHIHVDGYTDRLGSDAYNQTLSTRRANTVREYLVSKGVAADRIDATGHGKADQVKSCNDARRAELIACLAPNRRVVVQVEARH